MSDTSAMSNALAERKENPGQTGMTLYQKIQSQRPEIERALGAIAGQDPDRFLRVLHTAIGKSEKLQICTVQSILGSMMQAAQLGLEFGALGHAYLVPSKRKLPSGQFIQEARLTIGYRGFMDLHLRSGKVRSIVARPVYEKDVFEVWDDEDGDHYTRKPWLGADRGEIVRYYGRAVLTSGGSIIHVMELADIEARRERSRAKNDGPWVTDPVAMSQKTVVRAMTNWLPSSVEVSDALDSDQGRFEFDGKGIIPLRDEIEPPRISSDPEPERLNVVEATGEIIDGGAQDDSEGWQPDDDGVADPDVLSDGQGVSEAAPVDQELLDRAARMVSGIPVARVREILAQLGENPAGSEKAIRARCSTAVSWHAAQGDEGALALL